MFQPARHGRQLQRFDPQTGERLCCAAVVILRAADAGAKSSSKFFVLLVSALKQPDMWTFPKGGWDDDETAEACAAREAYEEGGVILTPVPVDPSGTMKMIDGSERLSASQLPAVAHQQGKRGGTPTYVRFFLFAVRRVLHPDEFPEASKRRRLWLPISLDGKDLALRREIVLRSTHREVLEDCVEQNELFLLVPPVASLNEYSLT